MLGDDFLAYLTLALGAALVVGNALAVMRPRRSAETGELVKAPLGWSLILMTVGGLATVWAVATIAT